MPTPIFSHQSISIWDDLNRSKFQDSQKKYKWKPGYYIQLIHPRETVSFIGRLMVLIPCCVLIENDWEISIGLYDHCHIIFHIFWSICGRSWTLCWFISCRNSSWDIPVLNISGIIFIFWSIVVFAFLQVKWIECYWSISISFAFKASTNWAWRYYWFIFIWWAQ